MDNPSVNAMGIFFWMKVCTCRDSLLGLQPPAGKFLVLIIGVKR
jgi:hypothetical protein